MSEGLPRIDPGPPSRPVWSALTGPHARWAQHGLAADGTVGAVRYDPEVSPFAAVADDADPAGWAALATIVEPGRWVVLVMDADTAGGTDTTVDTDTAGGTDAAGGTDTAGDTGDRWPPSGWKVAADIPGVRMVSTTMTPTADPQAVALGAADVPEMLELVARTRPGPFEHRTIELGGYVGFRHEGRLAAMGGRRFATGGYTEISGVCTDKGLQGRGLGSRVVESVAAGIVAEGAVPFLHAAGTNTNAIALYKNLGMEVCRSVRFVAVQRLLS